MNTKLLIPISITVTLLLCSSCKEHNEDTDSNNKNKKVFVDLYSNTYDNGRIYSSDPARFIDYETMESTVLCSKPNCTHTNSECIGRIVGDCPLMTEDYIYYFTFVDGVKELKDGKREPYINSKLNRISLETSEKEEVVAFDGIAPAEFNGMVLSDNRLYFTCDDLNPTADDYGNYCFNNAGGTHYFCCVDLDTSEFINYGSIYDDDKQYPGSDNTSNGLILGYYDNNILVDYHFAKTLEPWDKYGFPEFTDIMFEFDIDTNSLKQTDMYPIRNIVYKNAYVYYDMEKGRTVIVDHGQVREFDIDIGHFVSYFNNKLFDYDNNKWYDLSDMSEHKWIWDQEGYEVIDYYKDSYIVILGNTTLKLSEDDLFALDLKEE